MYRQVEMILSEDSSDNYFYDDEFIYVEELINQFSDEDWSKISQRLANYDDHYKIRLAYCIDEDAGMNGFNLLLDLLNESDEVVEYTLDSMRSFDTAPYKELIRSRREIVAKAEELLTKASLPVKAVLETFLQQNS